MGVDPGLVATGFGVLEVGPGGVTVCDAGVISTTTGQPLEARLNALHRAVHRIIELQSPGLLVVEDLYTEYKFPRTAILMGHARGVIYLAARQLGVSVLALAPSEVKRAMTGNGAAGKGQMQRAVQTVLGLKELPRPSHVADALGLAATGMARITGRVPGPAGGGPDHWPPALPLRRTTRNGPRTPPTPAHPVADHRPTVIASLRGKLRRKLEDRVVVEAAGVGYEVFVPPVTQQELVHAKAGDGDAADEVALEIHYHATQNQPRPVLIGFTSELDREFFEKLITVKDVGPMVAARSLAAPVGEIAAAIARQDEGYLRRLPGIGPQKAKNIVAQLQAKVAKFALARGEATSPEPAAAVAPDEEALRGMVFDILVKQLGYRPSEAAPIIGAALARRPGVTTPEELLDEIYRGGRKA